MQKSKTTIKSSKRVIAGDGMYGKTPIILLKIINPKREPVSVFIPKEGHDPMDVFNAFGDKVNELTKQGYEVEYKFNEKPIIINQ